MSAKDRILKFLATSLLLAVIGYVLTTSAAFNLCLHNQYSCRELLNQIGDPIFYGMGALSLVFLVLYSFPQAFSAWKKFAMWFVPLAALLFAVYPEPGSGDLFSPFPEQVFQWISAAYVIISLVIIGWSVWKK